MHIGPAHTRHKARGKRAAAAHVHAHVHGHAHRHEKTPEKAGTVPAGSSKPAKRILGYVNAPEGIRIVVKDEADRFVTQAELAQVLQGLRLLPAEDLRLLVKNNIPIELVPSAGLGGGLLGATTIVEVTRGKKKQWVPTLVRVAVRANLAGSQSTPEILQHEVGHAVAVLRRQDKTEEAATAYASRY